MPNYVAVSTAGAGGMIQMIPRTYAAIREQHPDAQLQADFVNGMRDHSNALKAMLLATGVEDIAEANPADSYWGVGGDGAGLNKLGKIMTRIREELRAAAN